MTAMIKIAGRPIGGGHPSYVIAEIGINHGGSETRCAEMITRAAEAGADAVKLQTVTAEESYHPDTESYRLFKDCHLDAASLRRLSDHAGSVGIALFSTPGDMTALQLLAEVGVPAIKISSGLLTNTPLISAAAALARPMILSTGMAHEDEVGAAVDAARDAGAREIAVLQCTSLYPAPPEALNLAAMETLAERFGVPVGYSDHFDGTLASIAAVARGAALIEKHFTLDRSVAGGDHAISLEPVEFADMVQSLRHVDAMIGSAEKRPDPAEESLRDGRHRCLVAARDMAAGTTLDVSDLFLMRLVDGSECLNANELDQAIGRRLARPVNRLQGLEPADLGGAG